MKSSYDFSKGKRGAVAAAPGKTRITIHIDNDTLAVFREQAAAQGKGYQTLINEALRLAVQSDGAQVTLESLRKVIREELRAA